jgi:hypothetical protein
MIDVIVFGFQPNSKDELLMVDGAIVKYGLRYSFHDWYSTNGSRLGPIVFFQRPHSWATSLPTFSFRTFSCSCLTL